MFLVCSQLLIFNKKMPALKQAEFTSDDDDITETEELLSKTNSGSTSLELPTEDEQFNHPNVPFRSLSYPEESLSCGGFVNRGFVDDEGLAEETLSPGFPLHPPDLNYLNKEEKGIFFSSVTDPEMPIKGMPPVQSLSVPEAHSWMETDRTAFISQRIQDLVQAFQARTEKVKERLVQPPTPSPSPPLENSSDTGQTPEPNSRPRLQSLIHHEDEKSEFYELSQYMKLCCCRIKRKFIPTFPNVIDPQSKIYISWLFFVMVSYVYNAWSIVLRAVFPYQTAENIPIFLLFDYAADIIYVLDVAVFKARLQFLHDGFWVDDYKKTRANYIQKTMFKMDVLSLFPLDLLYFIHGINPLFRLPRLLKVQTFWEFFHRVDAVAKTPYVIRIIRTLLYMMYLIHLNACAYYAMSTWEGIGSNGWVFQGNGNAYIRCFYFATKTATSIGKNPKPENEYEYVFMTISWLMGVFIFAFLIGQIRDIVATATQSRTQYRQLMDQTVMYMRNLNLPDDLQRRVRLWLNHTWEQQKTLNESGILDSLPRKMKTDVAINVHYNTLVKVQLFKDCDKALLRDLVLQLKPVLFLPGDYICRKGEVGKEMYIVNKGIVQVFGGENGDVVLATLSEGSVFGEISLLGIPGCNRRTADVRSKGFSNLFVLSKDDLWEALKNYPEAQKVLRKKAKCLIKENAARDQANKGFQSESEPDNVIKHEEKQPSTPKLIRAVMQVVPKDSKCVQLLSKEALKDTVLNIPTESQTISMEVKINNTESLQNSPENISCYSEKCKILSPKICTSPQLDKKAIPKVKPRSLSDGTLRKPDIIHEHEPIFVINKLSTKHSKENPLNKKNVYNEKDHFRNHQPEINEGSSSDFLKTILNMLPTELCNRRQSTVHPAVIQLQEYNQPNPNTNSEDSGISVDNSGHQSSDPKNQDEDSLSESQVDSCDSEDSSEMSTTSTRKIAIENSTSPPWKSNSSSILSLRGLFGNGSSQSSNSTNKDIHLSPVSKDGKDFLYTRPGSLTSGSSSAGYDNLAYVPVGILSRRSSIFSDASC
ncbi:cyclic nucleotide-gated cation channel beta-1-like isoform X2 [Stegodyphus dumicola]|uniref:cyclic nucleotide-gated cation channel beta-1-like isoform X2 n=1 Tax=Stegodyphus dumicola TaxID=202533 RepID=UPI0015A7FB28|nr:cyclic nucleotide-gated cation channel beta-1-like isoform X2 [Stegodyphus dumicola]